MPKKPEPPPPPSSSRATLALLAIGGLVVAGLVVWALTRTVETPAPVATTETMTTPAPVTSATSATSTSATGTTPLPVSVAPPQEQSNASIPRIAVEDLREKMKAGQVTVIDVRPAASYQTAHIEGAMNIPLASIETEMSSLPKGKPIVTYCT